MWLLMAFTSNSPWFHFLHCWEEEHWHFCLFKRQGHKDSRTEQTNSSLSTAQIISSGKVKVDLIFSLVLIKQLLHYLISHNQVKGGGWGGGVSNQYISSKSFWTVDCKFSPQMHFILFLMPC